MFKSETQIAKAITNKSVGHQKSANHAQIYQKNTMRIKWTHILAISILLQIQAAGSDKTYVIDGLDRVTWDEAFKLCQERGMELVSVENAAENAQLRQILGPAAASPEDIKDFWTSGKLTDSNHWVWASTGKPLTFADWAVGAPNNYLGHEKCLRLWGLHDFKWDDYFCQAKLHFVCQKRQLQGTLLAVDNAGSRSFERQPDMLSYDEDRLEADFEYAKVVTVRAPPEKPGPKEPMRWVRPKERIQKQTPMAQVLPPAPTRRLGLADGAVLRLDNVCFKVVTRAALDWEEARSECIEHQMELAVIGDGGQAERIREFLQENGLVHNSYWIGYLHAKTRRLRPRAADQWPMRDEEPFVQLTIGVKPGPSGFIVGAPSDKCPLLQPSDGMRMTFEQCQAKNHFICEKQEPRKY